MKTKVSEYIKRYNMLDDNDTVVIGVSGGPDSVCLLFLLQEIVKDYSGIKIEVVHVNHGIRQNASRDASFVKELCDTLMIDYHLAEASIPDMAKDMGLSEEEAGRMVRYDAFKKVLGNRKGKIAVAHNANDRAETMLFNLFRGSTIKGLGGIQPVNDNIIRPLLCLERYQIEEYLHNNRIEYVTDETNLQDEYTRNKIRHHIVEYATSNIFEASVRNMSKAADMFLEADSYISENAIMAAKRAIMPKADNSDDTVFNINSLLQEHPYIIKCVIYDAICYEAGRAKDITSEHVKAVMSILNCNGTKSVNLPYNIVATKEYDLLIIGKARNKNTSSAPKVKTQILEEFDMNNIPKGNYTKWFDYDKITNAPEIRTRKDGDYLTINSDLGRQSLQDFLVNRKIPKDVRDKVYLLADGAHIVWVIGYRISEYYKVSEGTKRVLEVTIDGGENG